MKRLLITSVAVLTLSIASIVIVKASADIPMQTKLVSVTKTQPKGNIAINVPDSHTSSTLPTTSTVTSTNDSLDTPTVESAPTNPRSITWVTDTPNSEGHECLYVLQDNEISTYMNTTETACYEVSTVLPPSPR